MILVNLHLFFFNLEDFQRVLETGKGCSQVGEIYLAYFCLILLFRLHNFEAIFEKFERGESSEA